MARPYYALVGVGRNDDAWVVDFSYACADAACGATGNYGTSPGGSGGNNPGTGTTGHTLARRSFWSVVRVSRGA